MFFKTIIVVIASLLLIDCTQSTNNQNGENEFGIYLLLDKSITTSEAKTINLGLLKLQTEPIICLDDIISYDWSTHTIDLQTEAFERFKSLDTMNVSTYGLPFLVLVGNERIYLGNIYPMYSSLYHFDLPTINVAPFIDMKIEKPLDEFEDTRTDSRIFEVLKNNNKLKN